MPDRVLIVQRRMPEFRVPLFERLHRRLAEAGVRLQVIYGTPTRAEEMRGDGGVLPWGIPIPCHYLSVGDSFAALQRVPRYLAEQQDLVILPHENSMLNNHVLLMLQHSRRLRLAFWGHGANFQARGGNFLREKFKAWTSRHAHWWFAYTALSVERVAQNGFPAERISCIDNAVDTQALVRWRNSFNHGELEALRLRLGLKGNKIGVFVGSLHRDKRIDFLLDSADRLRARDPDFELLLIGDGPLREMVRTYAASRPWCKWVAARHGPDKALHLALGRVLLNPGMVGLGILDGFAMGLPLVTTDCGIHSPEIAYLEPNMNGVMSANSIEAFVEAVGTLLDDDAPRKRMVAGCEASASRYTLEHMAERFCDGILRALDAPALDTRRQLVSPRSSRQAATSHRRNAIPEWHIAVIWQRFLPYHVARIRRLRERCTELGYRLTAIEVASQDDSYQFDFAVKPTDYDRKCCYPGESYHEHGAREIHAKVLTALNEAQPDVVFAPATPFPEGMAAAAYRRQSGARMFMMDDAWEHTDRRGALVHWVKSLIHSNIDGAFIPAPTHASHYKMLGFPEDRIILGVDVVDNDRFSTGADSARSRGGCIEVAGAQVSDYFLFVGRFAPRKGLRTLLASYARYRERAPGRPWDLVVVGGGRGLREVWEAGDTVGGVYFAGPKYGDDLCRHYGLAKALIVPSELDQWGLVVNEGLAAGLPVLVCTGCGSAPTLVSEGENGWCFPPRDVALLTELLLRLGTSSPETLARMGARSREIIAAWSLDRFVDGVLQGMRLPRSMPGGILADFATWIWKGRISIN